jgi:hypothetical protein
MIEAVKCAELIEGKLDRFGSGFRVSGICSQSEGRFAERLLGRFRVFRIAANDDDTRTLFYKGPCGGKSEAGCPADDNERFSIESATAHFVGKTVLRRQ